MDKKCAFLDLLHFSEFDFLDRTLSLKDLINDFGFSDLSTDDLLDILKMGTEEVQEAWESRIFEEGEKGIQSYHNIGRRFAPVACVLYERLSKEGKEPRLSTYLAANRFQSTGCPPDTVLFWADPDAIKGLYESLEKDGFYGRT